MNDPRRYIIQFIIVLVGLIFLSKLFYLQIIDTKYKIAAKDNTVRRDRIYPYRGDIRDRNGKLIVYNIPVFDLMVVKRKVNNIDTTSFCNLLKIEKTVFKTKLDEITGLFTNKPQAFIKQISVEEHARIQDKFRFNGFYFEPRMVRSYSHNMLANALGYIAEISPEQLARDSISYYKQGDYVGKSGVESTYEPSLRGEPGARFVMVNVKGIEKGRFDEGRLDTAALAGHTLISTIDTELQLYGELLMKNKVGSIVAIEPKTGEILSIVSSPSYDPNDLTGRAYSTNYGKLLMDPKKPLTDRATQAHYPPGSIFKLVQAAIYLQDGVIKNGHYYNIPPYPRMGDHSPAGAYNIQRAIKVSSNWFFAWKYRDMLEQKVVKNQYEDAEIGFDKWRDYLVSFGFGSKLGSDIRHENGGRIPSNAYYDKLYGDKRWKASTIISNGIGQGEIEVTPLQMANLTAVIANRGYYYIPHMIKEVVGDTTNVLKKYKERINTKVDSIHFEPIIEGMEGVVNEPGGTAYWRGRLENIIVCGKTGTAENSRGKDHAVFIAFAPKDDPKIAIAVYVENAGFGGTWAAPIATLMIEKYLEGKTSREWIEKFILDANLID